MNLNTQSTALNKQTTTLNRQIAPDFHSIQPFTLMAPENKQYPNGLKAFVFDGGEQDLVRVEWIFENRYDKDDNALIHSCLAPMLLEGTRQLSNAEIADQIDFHGAYLVPEFNSDHSSLTLFTLNKHLPRLLPLIRTLFTDASFPEKEWNTYLRNRKQRLEISLRKNDVLARREFNRRIFGENRYGGVTEPSDLDHLSRELPLNLYRQQFTPSNCSVFIAGQVPASTLSLFEKHFVEEWPDLAGGFENSPPFLMETNGETYIQTIPDALQSAIRMGYRTIQRSHPDFPGLQFVNTVLGGYFGSRLMANIREDKGYTYGIGSGIADMKHTAYFTLATEVGVEVTENTLNEIEKEINLLKEKAVPAEEMELVRNYMMGSLLGSLENIFSHADKFKQAYFSGIGLEYFDYYQQVILKMDAPTVQQLANTYLDFDRMEKIIVGKL